MKKDASILTRVLEAQTRPFLMDKLIEDYEPFIAKTVKEHVGHYVTYGKDDELSVAMLAFTEAVKAYNPNKGAFLSFAKHIICLRLIDFYRKEKRLSQNEIELKITTSNQGIIAFDEIKAVDQYKQEQINRDRKIEILTFKDELTQWNLAFTDLVKHTPKSALLKKQYQQLAHLIVRNEMLLNKCIQSKRLPIKELENLTSFNRKKIERGRIYIIACTIVLKGQYDYIKDYINWR